MIVRDLEGNRPRRRLQLANRGDGGGFTTSNCAFGRLTRGLWSSREAVLRSDMHVRASHKSESNRVRGNIPASTGRPSMTALRASKTSPVQSMYAWTRLSRSPSATSCASSETADQTLSRVSASSAVTSSLSCCASSKRRGTILLNPRQMYSEGSFQMDVRRKPRKEARVLCTRVRMQCRSSSDRSLNAVRSPQWMTASILCR